ncbi:MAG: hypothetical protein K2P81_11210 [Bacteriovoracaceae bacterium]|nr:hypothetical protein [Bacteriovoracaceae bacterium]
MKNSLWIILMIISTSAWSAALKLETKYGRIFVPEKPTWELGKDLFGMPFIYFSPQVNGQRSNISFTNTGVDLEIDLKAMSENPEAFKKMKNDWAQEVNATPVDYIPYKKWKNQQGHSVHEVGFQYRHENKEYIEKSIYIDCNGRLIYSKSLRLIQNSQHDKDFKELIDELDCGV